MGGEASEIWRLDEAEYVLIGGAIVYDTDPAKIHFA